MLVVASGSGISTSKEKPTEKHLFAMASSKVSTVRHKCVVYSVLYIETVGGPIARSSSFV